MTMAQHQSITAPFMSQDKSLKVGLNQLGMRGIGEQLFGTLLPGLNNVSSRIRYYAFYCWLFNHYFSDNDKAYEQHYRSYLRRAELLLALINHERVGIPGVTYANNEYSKGLASFSLIDGTEGSTRYWINAGGIFGQYYVQSMVDIGLVHSIPDKEGRPTAMYNSTERGKKLSNIFEQSIGHESSNLFFVIMQRNEASREEIEQMREPFDMLCPCSATTERKYLTDLLIGADYPDNESSSHYRAETIKYVLEWIDNEHPSSIKDMDFVEYIYTKFHSRKQQDTPPSLWGWYAYAVNEDWQYQSSIVFTALLDKYLNKHEGCPWMRTDDVVNNMANAVCEDFALKPNVALREAIMLCSEAVPKGMDEMPTAIATLLHNYHRNKSTAKNLEPLRMAFHNLTTDNVFTFMGKVELMENATLFEFLRYFIKEEIIYRHYKEAFRKQSATGIATQKFAMESGCIRYLSDIDYSHSSPRLTTLFGFLEDLRIIDNKGLTKNGEQLINTLENDFTA